MGMVVWWLPVSGMSPPLLLTGKMAMMISEPLSESKKVPSFGLFLTSSPSPVVLSKWNHPNIIKPTAIVREYSELFFIFEYMVAASLMLSRLNGLPSLELKRNVATSISATIAK
ncbi:hypothetical protein SSX86_001929 [Deinandra increscens subsp. villosa]|uniref:Uncharacterized protein n=1 Tax=Deinandra increscens subsp. villosa TaxID=3103831 RepID=A0AAP0DVV7_9ASTR